MYTVQTHLYVVMHNSELLSKSLFLDAFAAKLFLNGMQHDRCRPAITVPLYGNKVQPIQRESTTKIQHLSIY